LEIFFLLILDPVNPKVSTKCLPVIKTIDALSASVFREILDELRNLNTLNTDHMDNFVKELTRKPFLTDNDVKILTEYWYGIFDSEDEKYSIRFWKCVLSQYVA